MFGEQELFVKTESGSIEPYHPTETEAEAANFKYIDGSLSCDIPIPRMSQLFNITSYIVSQVNPHGVVFAWDL